MSDIIEPFTYDERLIMLRLAVDEQLRKPDERVLRIISRLSGTDTLIVAKRSCPSRPVADSPGPAS